MTEECKGLKHCKKHDTWNFIDVECRYCLELKLLKKKIDAERRMMIDNLINLRDIQLIRKYFENEDSIFAEMIK